MRRIFLFSILCFLISDCCFSDTIDKWDGRELKGIVVEDYSDRVVFSTPDGEVQVMKSDIRSLRYDSEEDNLIKLGERARERGDYATAYAYYDKALTLNPGSKAAKDGVVYLQGFLFRIKEAKKEEDIKRRTEYERYQIAGLEEKTAEELWSEELKALKSSLGIALKQEGIDIKISEVAPRSPASDAGIKRGDHLAAIWGRLTNYMDIKDVVRLLMKEASKEIKATIERSVEVGFSGRRGLMSNVKGLTGLTLSMEFDGLTASELEEASTGESAGLKKGDLIISINDKPTRYMPLKTAIGLIKGTRADYVTFKIRRDATIWRR